MAKARIGISGWRYAPWRGDFYPRGLPQRSELEYASRRFDTIEINGSFYALQRPTSYERWRTQAPRGFVFAVKAPRFITHVRRLRDAAQPLANFFASGVLRLREKLGPILWQLPPSFRYEPALVDEFLAQLPHDTEQAAKLARQPHEGPRRRLRHALEVRHESFRDERFVATLRRRGVALVVADTARRWPLFEDVTAGFMYLRLHGDEELYVSGYSERALVAWAERIRRWLDGAEPDDARRISARAARGRRGRDVYCYFDNDAKVRAPCDAQHLARLLERRPDAAHRPRQRHEPHVHAHRHA
ncbi:DUF72 domain-containing protein [Frateuria defendens]|uniref:DUF72 domain-containing protein n=1 Tax=Frateuria defendens TaxID=2219559 RepID=UPI0007DC15CF|nr:DUF72 domain-containing protein [Frateuria defendens]